MKIAWLFALTLCHSIAQLKFETVEHHSALDPKEESVEISFPFLAEADTEISGYFSHCGCLKAITPQKLWSRGEAGEIKLQLDTRQISGTTRKSLEINFKNAPQQKLTIEAAMPTAITRSPKSHIWEAGAPPEVKEFEIIIHKEFDFTIKDLVIPNKKFNIELVADPDNDKVTDKTFTLKVIPPEDEGQQICMIKVLTTSKIKRYQSFNLLAIKK